MEAFQSLEVQPYIWSIFFQLMEVGNFYALISEKLNTLIFALDTHYISTKVKNYFQQSVNRNAQFVKNLILFQKILFYNKLVIGTNF